MVTLIDSSLWIDFTRAKTPTRLRQQILPYALDSTGKTLFTAYKETRKAISA